MNWNRFKYVMGKTSTLASSLNTTWFPTDDKSSPLKEAIRFVTRSISSYESISDWWNEVRSPTYDRDTWWSVTPPPSVLEALEHIKNTKDFTKTYYWVSETMQVKLDYGKFSTNNYSEYYSWSLDVMWEAHSYKIFVKSTHNPWNYVGMSKITVSKDPVVLSDDLKVSIDRMMKRAERTIAFKKTRKILLYGPPGTGKSILAMKIGEWIFGSGMKVLSISPNSTIDQVWIKRMAPNIIVLNDVDRKKDGDLISFLEDVSGIPNLIVATVNSFDAMDPALLRAGRFDEMIEVPLPDAVQRRAILNEYSNIFGTVLPETAVEDTEGLSPAFLKELVYSLQITEDYAYELERLKTQASWSSDEKTKAYIQKMAGTVDPIDPVSSNPEISEANPN